MGRPKNEHPRVARTLVVDERDDIALRAWANDRYGNPEKSADIVRDAIVDALRRSGRLTREVAATRQRTLWFGHAPLIGWRDGMRVTSKTTTPIEIAWKQRTRAKQAGRCCQCGADIPKGTAGSIVGGQAFAPETCGHETCVEMNGGVR